MSKILKKDDGIVSIKFSLLQRIAEYYEFPSAVFFMQKKDLPKGKRKQYLYDKIKKFKNTIQKFLDEF